MGGLQGLGFRGLGFSQGEGDVVSRMIMGGYETHLLSPPDPPCMGSQ